jgi:hypothetical protein
MNECIDKINIGFVGHFGYTLSYHCGMSSGKKGRYVLSHLVPSTRRWVTRWWWGARMLTKLVRQEWPPCLRRNAN